MFDWKKLKKDTHPKTSELHQKIYKKIGLTDPFLLGHELKHRYFFVWPHDWLFFLFMFEARKNINLCRLSTPIIFFLHSWAKSTVWISNRLVKAFSHYWTEIKFQMAQIHPVNFKVADRGKHSRVMESKFKMAAMAATLEKMWHPFSIGYVSFLGPIHPVNFKVICANILG